MLASLPGGTSSQGAATRTCRCNVVARSRRRSGTRPALRAAPPRGGRRRRGIRGRAGIRYHAGSRYPIPDTTRHPRRDGSRYPIPRGSRYPIPRTRMISYTLGRRIPDTRTGDARDTRYPHRGGSRYPISAPPWLAISDIRYHAVSRYPISRELRYQRGLGNRYPIPRTGPRIRYRVSTSALVISSSEALTGSASSLTPLA